MTEKSDKDIIRLVFGRLKMSGKKMGGKGGEEEQKGKDPTSLNSEQVAEQEQEQEQEQEEEREQEQEQEQEIVRPQDEGPLPHNFTKKEELPGPWFFFVVVVLFLQSPFFSHPLFNRPAVVLGVPSAVETPEKIANMFYPLAKFAVHTSLR